MNSSVFSDFRNRARDAEELTASARLFQTEVAAAEIEKAVEQRITQL